MDRTRPSSRQHSAPPRACVVWQSADGTWRLAAWKLPLEGYEYEPDRTAFDVPLVDGATSPADAVAAALKLGIPVSECSLVFRNDEHTPVCDRFDHLFALAQLG